MTWDFGTGTPGGTEEQRLDMQKWRPCRPSSDVECWSQSRPPDQLIPVDHRMMWRPMHRHGIRNENSSCDIESHGQVFVGQKWCNMIQNLLIGRFSICLTQSDVLKPNETLQQHPFAASDRRLLIVAVDGCSISKACRSQSLVGEAKVN